VNSRPDSSSSTWSGYYVVAGSPRVTLFAAPETRVGNRSSTRISGPKQRSGAAGFRSCPRISR
jgi:hypothetical protein